MKLLFDFPWYCVLFCLLAGVFYSALLYWRRHADEATLPRPVRLLLPLLRLLSVSLIALLLTAPLVRRNVGTHEKPIIVVAQDRSQSVPTDQRDIMAGQLDAMERDYQLVLDTFGDRSTDIAAALSSVADRYAGRNLGAVVLASDGIYNQGQNPTAVAQQLAVPVYTVALGDTTRRRDAAIAHVRFNRMAYLGNLFPVEVTVRAHRLSGERATLSVMRGGQRLFSKELRYTDGQFTATETLVLDADKAGLQSFTVSITPCEGEASIRNNSRTIAVEVLDGHQKIALLAAAPHPDISALKQSIERNPNYEVSVHCPANSIQPEKLRDCSLLVLHNLPSFGNQLNLASLSQIPTIYIIGIQTDLDRFNALHTGLEIVAKSRKTDEVTPMQNTAFALFTLADDICGRIEQFPPLSAPFGTYRPAGNLQSLFTAKVGGVSTERPLIAFCQQEGVRHAFVVGEGLWRWRLQDYLMTGSNADFDQLVEKMVVYTSLQANRDRLQVTHERIYQENEPVVIQAELYNDNFEPVNDPVVQFTLQKVSEGENPIGSTYVFNRSGSGYTLHLGLLAPGHYNYTASATLAGKSHTATGSFIVEELNLEEMNLTADHTLLATLSSTTGAQMLSPDQLERLPQLLKERDDLKTVVYSHTRYTELLSLPWLFVLLVLLLSVEWAVRKYYLS